VTEQGDGGLIFRADHNLKAARVQKMDLRKEMFWNKRVLGEMLFISVMGIITMVEAFKLIFIKDPAAIYDPIGPGPYLLVVSMMFIGGGVVHLVTHWRKSVGDQKAVVDKKLRRKLISTVVNCAIYLLLISAVGYLISTPIFFLLQFRIEGVRSWLRNLTLTLVISATYYFVFVKYCSLIFPRGILFE
jgi:hypothetical protein